MTVVKQPDGDRLEDLMRRYGDALVRMCCLYLNDASLAQDAAQALRISQSAVKQRLRRANRRLRDRLKEWYYDA